MDIKLETINFDADQKLIEFTNSKVSKLENYFDSIISTEVFLTFDKSKKNHTENKEAKIKLSIPGTELFAEKEAKTFEEAIDLSTDAIKKQLKRHKEKTRS